MSRRYPNPIVINPSLPKCIPHSRICARADRCASQLVSGDGRGRRDYTAGNNYWTPLACEGWLHVDLHRPDPVAPKPTVHDTPKGLK